MREREGERERERENLKGGGKINKQTLNLPSVDKESLAEVHGLQIGDQILMVNGHSFRNILHDEAVAVLRVNPLLVMTVKVTLTTATTCQQQ